MFIMSGSQKLSKKNQNLVYWKSIDKQTERKKPTLFSAPHPAQNQPSTWVKF